MLYDFHLHHDDVSDDADCFLFNPTRAKETLCLTSILPRDVNRLIHEYCDDYHDRCKACNLLLHAWPGKQWWTCTGCGDHYHQSCQDTNAFLPNEYTATGIAYNRNGYRICARCATAPYCRFCKERYDTCGICGGFFHTRARKIDCAKAENRAGGPYRLSNEERLCVYFHSIACNRCCHRVTTTDFLQCVFCTRIICRMCITNAPSVLQTIWCDTCFFGAIFFQ